VIVLERHSAPVDVLAPDALNVRAIERSDSPARARDAISEMTDASESITVSVLRDREYPYGRRPVGTAPSLNRLSCHAWVFSDLPSDSISAKAPSIVVSNFPELV
jgi:hypothetical protein